MYSVMTVPHHGGILALVGAARGNGADSAFKPKPRKPTISIHPAQRIPRTSVEVLLIDKGMPVEQPKPPRRKRKPILASVSRQARTAGIEVAAYEVRPDGMIKVITGKPTVVSDGDDASPIDRSEWN